MPQSLSYPRSCHLAHSQLRLHPLTTKLLPNESAEILVQRVDGALSLHKLNHTPDIPIRPDHNHARLPVLESHLRMRRPQALNLRNPKVLLIVRKDVVSVSCQQLRQTGVGAVVQACMGCGENGGETEEARVWVVEFVIGYGVGVGAEEGREVAVWLEGVRGEGFEGGVAVGGFGGAAEDEDAEGAVHGDGVF